MEWIEYKRGFYARKANIEGWVAVAKRKFISKQYLERLKFEQEIEPIEEVLKEGRTIEQNRD
jgi:hypothetical protein